MRALLAEDAGGAPETSEWLMKTADGSWICSALYGSLNDQKLHSKAEARELNFLALCGCCGLSLKICRLPVLRDG